MTTKQHRKEHFPYRNENRISVASRIFRDFIVFNFAFLAASLLCVSKIFIADALD